VPEIVPFLQILFATLGVAVPIVLLVKVLRGDGQGSIANLLAAPDYGAWPHGVQEEEPIRWGARVAS
jgi:hypothetical protein